MDDQVYKSWTSPYTAREERQVPNGGGAWNSTLISIFENETKIGEFQRNYPSYGVSTFAPFQRNGQWYALYAPRYTGLQVMRLPDCTPLGGEACGGNGFCPVEVWVPTYQERLRKGYTEEELQKYPKANWGWLSQDSISREYDQGLWKPDSPILFEDFALVTGCIWGDDNSWKLELRDLSQAAEGILKSVPGWGYHPLWGELRESVRLYSDTQLGGEPRKYLNIEFAEITQKRVFCDAETLEPVCKEE